jgi:hypothetical protein
MAIWKLLWNLEKTLVMTNLKSTLYLVVPFGRTNALLYISLWPVICITDDVVWLPKRGR